MPSASLIAAQGKGRYSVCLPIGVRWMGERMAIPAAVEVAELSHVYGQRKALDRVSFRVEPGEVFAFLGPNGGGKTTLFRILSTLLRPQAGRVRVFGKSADDELISVRQQMGVVFQSPSLDKKLTVDENIAQQAALYGLHGQSFQERREEVLTQLGLLDLRSEQTESLSGGLRRRVDLAKGLIHRPRLLLLDEPSTGLDPGVRSDLWQYLNRLRDKFGVTIVLTSHLLDEADRADRIAILNHGKMVAQGKPGELRSAVGGESISIESSNPEDLAERINRRWDWNAQVIDQVVRFSCEDGVDGVGRVMREFAEHVQSIKLGKPTLEDVFIKQTGHRFWQDSEETSPA